MTTSDLSLFAWHHRSSPRVRQKAINLNANPFTSTLYPGLPEATSGTGKVSVDLYLYGPGVKGEYNQQRKIVRGQSYKNWRLNGELVHNPDEDPTRFDVLMGGDLVVFEFFGDMTPESVRAVFLGRAVAEDSALHSAFDGIVGSGRNDSMVALTPSRLQEIIETADVPDGHPVRDLVSLDTTLEGATLGDEQVTTNLRRPPSDRKRSREELLRARNNADKVGELGEQFVNSYLASLKSSGKIDDFEWTSRENAVSSFDFKAEAGGERFFVDSKATELGFDSWIHVSLGELRRMCNDVQRYDLYRVFEMEETNAKLRIAENLRGWAEGIITTLEGLPEGVQAQGVTVRPSKLQFGAEIEVEMLEEPEEPEEQTTLFNDSEA